MKQISDRNCHTIVRLLEYLAEITAGDRSAKSANAGRMARILIRYLKRR